MQIRDHNWWHRLKRLKGNWMYSPDETEGLIHMTRGHVSDLKANGRCKFCNAKAPAGIRMISKLQKGFKK